MMRSAQLLLTPERAAVFSRNSTTEGAHKTLLGPPGGALLGWAAAGGRYDDFKGAAWTIFHSGRVRFSNATPLTDNGEPAWPAPQILTYPKTGPKAFVDGRLNQAADVRIGRPNDDTKQREVMKGLLSASFKTVRTTTGGRLRTALERGAAAPGRLFGYAHIEPGEDTLYAAAIEADDGALSDLEWRTLVAAFDGKVLSLGRGAGTSYGGGYACEARDGEGLDLWPRGRCAQADGKRVRVWALSDCALLDERGMPTFRPTSEALGLPNGGILDERESAISARRYAPWNRTLKGRDLDRQVIEAGSVFTFRYANGVPWDSDGPGSVGLWREAGLGRIWVSPPFLKPEFGDLLVRSGEEVPRYASSAKNSTVIEHERMDRAHRELKGWLGLEEARHG